MEKNMYLKKGVFLMLFIPTLTLIAILFFTRGTKNSPGLENSMLTPPAPYKLSNLESYACSPGNPSGGRGTGFAGNRHTFFRNDSLPNDDERTAHVVSLKPGETITLANVEGMGMVQSIWLTFANRSPEDLRSNILRIYWDGSEHPSVLSPIGDFFNQTHGRSAHFSTPYLGVSEGKGYHCFFPMPFSKGFKITLENNTEKSDGVFYHIIFTKGNKVTDDMGRFHAHFRRHTPPVGENFVMLDVENTPGVYVGATISALPQKKGTWREGDIRFFIDSDTKNPSIVGTGWSDWFLSAWGLAVHQSMYAGSNYQVIHPEMKNKYFCNSYRFHVLDPIYFSENLRVEYTQQGSIHESPDDFTESRSEDWCCVVYWYQKLQDQPLPALPSKEERIKGISIPDWEKDAKMPQAKSYYYTPRNPHDVVDKSVLVHDK